MAQAIPAAIGAISSASVGTLLSVGATLVGGFAQMSAANAAAAVSASNAEAALKNADSETLRYQQEAAQKDEAAKAELGAMVAQQSASGLNLNTGSSALSRVGKAKLAGRDRERIGQAGYNNVKDYLQQAKDYASEAKQKSKAGTYALVGSFFNAGGSLLDGATQVNKNKAATLARTGG